MAWKARTLEVASSGAPRFSAMTRWYSLLLGERAAASPSLRESRSSRWEDRSMSIADLARGVRTSIPASCLELHLFGMNLSPPSLPGVLLPGVPGVAALEGERRAAWTGG